MTILWNARQYGFTNSAGAIGNIVDGDPATFYKPLATDFSAYTDQFLLSDGTLNYGKPFAALEFWGSISDHDPAVPQHITTIILGVETSLTLGPAVIIGSNNPASSVSNTLQVGDVLLGQFTQAQITSGKVLLLPAMQVGDATYAFYRLLQRSNKSADLPPDPSVGTNFRIIDSGAGNFVVPAYSGKFIVELWGGAASGGDNTGGVDGNNTTCTTYSLTAGKGLHSTTSGPNGGAAGASGGTATGGNTLNIAGNPGQSPSPNTTAIGLSGPGGAAPFGGAGGGAVFNDVFGGLKFGLNGVAPGGGGSGLNAWSNTSGGVAFKFPGGGSGGYVRHELTRGIDGPAPGATVAYSVGAGGHQAINGSGANGRVKFSWT